MDLASVLSEALDTPKGEFTSETKMLDIPNWDSMSHMFLITHIEETFNIDLTAEEIADMTSVSAIESILQSKGATIK